MKLLITILLILPYTAIAQNYWEEWDSDEINQLYERRDLPSGTLCEEGEEIDYVLIETDLEEGVYEVEITDDEGDLYYIKGTDYYLTFRGYHGYAGYGEDGILEINSYGGGYFYEEP